MHNSLWYSSVKLELFSKDESLLKQASGFVVEAANRYYLITNRHVLAGQDVRASVQPDFVIKPYIHRTSYRIQ